MGCMANVSEQRIPSRHPAWEKALSPNLGFSRGSLAMFDKDHRPEDATL